MKKLNVAFTSTITALACITSIHSQAAGFMLEAQSATGVGRAYAGDGIIADNASSMAINPASMALFDKTSLTFGLQSVTTDISVKNASYSNNLNGADNVNADASQAGGTDLIPNFHLIVPVNEKWALGMSMYTNFGTATEFDDDYVAKEYGGYTRIASAELGLAASYRVNQQWSLGAGLDLIYGKGTIQRDMDIKHNNGTIIKPDYSTNTISALDVDADGFGVGFNLGATYELDSNNRWGLSYHYSPEITATGDISSDISMINPGNELYVPLPSFVDFAGYNRFEGTKFALSYSVKWSNWKVFDTLDSNTGTIEHYEWRNQFHVAVGGTYYLNDTWTLRTGYMFDQSAQDDVNTVAVPDSNRHWFSAGFSYALTNSSTVDFGMTYLLGRDNDVHEDKLPVSEITGTTRADAFLAGIQYSKTF